MLSRSAEYAIRALSLLAVRHDDGALHSREIAADLGLPPQFLTKILRRLTATELVASQRGRSGGFRLNRPADQISLIELVLQFEQQWTGVPCILGQAYCSDQAACPIHDEWVGIRKAMYDLLERTTLADVAERAVRAPLTSDDPVSGVSRT
jgi:Rrf2 family protein